MSLFLLSSSSQSFSFCRLLELYWSKMDTRYCSACMKKLSPPFFFRDASSSPSSRVFATCYVCREKRRVYTASKKRPALQELYPNVSAPPARRRATSRALRSPSVLNYSPVPPLRYPLPPVQCPSPIHPPVSPVRSLQSSSIQPPPTQPLPVQPLVQPPRPPLDTFVPAD